jgi:hypothetical protein
MSNSSISARISESIEMIGLVSLLELASIEMIGLVEFARSYLDHSESLFFLTI